MSKEKTNRNQGCQIENQYGFLKKDFGGFFTIAWRIVLGSVTGKSKLQNRGDRVKTHILCFQL